MRKKSPDLAHGNIGGFVISFSLRSDRPAAEIRALRLGQGVDF